MRSALLLGSAMCIAAALVALVETAAGCTDCVDYRDDPQPALIGSLDITEDPFDIVVRDDVAYLVTSDIYASDPPAVQELVAVDVSDPSAPVQLDALASPWGHAMLDVTGDFAYAAGPSLAKFDVSDPAAILPAGFLDATEFPGQDAIMVDVEGDVAYVITDSEELLIVDVSGDPAIVASLPLPSINLNHLAVRDAHAYIVGNGGLFVVDATVPASPIVISTAGTANQGIWIRLVDEHAIVSVSGNPSSIFDVSHPEFPVLLTAGPSLAGFEIAGDLMYATIASVLRVYDVSDPADPDEIGSLSGVLAFGVSVDGCRVATFNPFLPEELRLFPAHCAAATEVPEPGLATLGTTRGIPNPFRSLTTLHYEAAGAACVGIYDVGGRLVSRLEDATAGALGPRRLTWDGRDGDGRPLGAGTYYYRVESSAGVARGHVTLVR